MLTACEVLSIVCHEKVLPKTRFLNYSESLGKIWSLMQVSQAEANRCNSFRYSKLFKWFPIGWGERLCI